jgi:RNA polymerase sigma-70 factor, ECF subfamily
MNEAVGHRAVGRGELRTSPANELADEDALSALYHRDYHQFVRVAEAITGTIEDAQDAVQEGFASALRQLDRFEGRGSLEGWVWRCVINAARMSRRRSARATRLGDVSELGDLRASGPEPPPVRLLPQLGRLPERQRLVLFLRYFADLSYEAIADAMEISPGTVAAALNAAHRSLRRWLQEVEK